MKACDLKKGTFLAPVCLLTGGDLYWTSYALSALIAAVPEEERDLRVETIEGGAVDELIFALKTPSLSGGSKYVVARGRTGKLSLAEERALKNYCASPAEDAVLVLCDEKGVFSCLKEYCAIVDCAAPETQDGKDFLYERAREAGVRIGAPAMALLYDYCNADAGRASRELEKISAYLGGAGEADAALVRELVAPDERAKAYELTNALSSGNKAAAAQYLSKLSASGVQSSAVLRSLASAYRGLLFLRISTIDDFEAAKALGVKPYAVKKMRPVAKRYSAVTLKGICDKLNDLEYHFKSGRLSADSALDLAICRIMGVKINV